MDIELGDHVKPATRSSARSRPRNLDSSPQLELFPSLPVPAEVEPAPPEPPAPPTVETVGTTAIPESQPQTQVTEPDLVPAPAPDLVPDIAPDPVPQVEEPSLEEPSLKEPELDEPDVEEPNLEEHELSSNESPFPDDATDFDPAQLEAMTTVPEDHPVPSDTPPPPAAVPAAAAAPTEEEQLADLFESDPFFNPVIAPPVPAPSTPAEPSRTEPEPTAEERLLDSIVGKPAKPTEALALETPVPADEPVPVDEPPPADEPLSLPPEQQEAMATEVAAQEAIAQVIGELDRARARVSELETELTRAREQAAREIQLRKAESVRHAAVEREWARKSLAASSGTLDKHDSLKEDSPQHRPAHVVALTLVLAAFAVALAFFAGRSCESRRVHASDVTASPAPVDSAAEALPSPMPAIASPRAEPPSPPAPWPVLEGAGFKTSRKGNELTLRFNYGAFARGTELTGAACQDLRRIANTLTPAMGNLHLEVEGHTDATPVSSGRPYGNNRELGLARAKVVVDYLSKQCGLPVNALSATSAGDATPPYPNTTPESRRLNRTVVLKVTPAENH